jgi:hypothetical protein
MGAAYPISAVTDGLRDYLVDRLAAPAAGRHIAAGEEASLRRDAPPHERLAAGGVKF